MSDTDLLRHPGEGSPWTPRVLTLLREWNDRAGATAETHYAISARLSRLNVRLGIPVVVLTTFVGTSVFATLERHVDLSWKILIGTVSVLAAVLASLQTFLRFAERAEKHRAAAEEWSSIRREISEMLALHPDYLATRGDPKDYLDRLRRRMDRIAAQSPEMGDRAWSRAEERYGLTYRTDHDTGAIEGSAPSLD